MNLPLPHPLPIHLPPVCRSRRPAAARRAAAPAPGPYRAAFTQIGHTDASHMSGALGAAASVSASGSSSSSSSSSSVGGKSPKTLPLAYSPE